MMHSGPGINSASAAIFTVSLVFATQPVFAQQTDAEAETVTDSSARIEVFDGWSGTASLGASTSTGSAETSSVNGSLRVGKRADKWAHWFSASAFKGESAVVAPRRGADGEPILDDNGEQILDIVRGNTSDRLELSYQPRYYFTGNTYGFLTFGWGEDEPAGVVSEGRQIIGVGHRFYADDTGYLSVEIGAGNKNIETVSGEQINGGVGYLAANYLYRINQNVTFNANLLSDFGSENQSTDAAVGIAFKLTETLAFGISHFVRSNSDVTNEQNPLSGRRDSVTTMNLVVDI